MTGYLATAMTIGAAVGTKLVAVLSRRQIFCVCHALIGFFLGLAGYLIQIHHGFGAFCCILLS
jgi:hypothetical protein|tara:strand:- start:679 stop:867 length:189 start_codon:yes stop_codon:yes gene_type:complete